MLKKIIGISFTLLIVAVLVFILIRNPKQTRFTVVKESYNTVSIKDEESSIVIDFYINKKDSFITDVNNIATAYISDQNQNNLINIDVEEFNYVGSIKIDNEKFYLYKINIGIDFNNDIELKEAYLQINYYNQENLKVNIGSFSSYKIDSFGSNNLSITNLKGIVNMVNGKKTLVGFAIKLNNINNKNIDVLNIIPLDVNLECGRASDVKNINIKSNKEINAYLDYPYLFDQKTEFKPLTINSEKYLLVPVYYNNHFEINNFGLKIDYQIGGLNKCFYFNEFTFFIDHERTIDLTNLTFYHYG